MKFKGFVADFNHSYVWLRLEPDDGKPEEMWKIERDQVPKRWLQKGAVCEVEVGPKEGHVVWSFDCSYWTAKDIRKVERDAKILAKELGLK
jgi:hypothetical protein